MSSEIYGDGNNSLRTRVYCVVASGGLDERGEAIWDLLGMLTPEQLESLLEEDEEEDEEDDDE